MGFSGIFDSREGFEGVFWRSRLFSGRDWGSDGEWEGVMGNVWVGVRAMFG